MSREFWRGAAILLAFVIASVLVIAAAKAETCRASFYGLESCRGKHICRTANGEAFRPGALTAAHRSLPFGALIGVRAYAHGRPLGPKITLRVTDRGPARWTRRCLDVSEGAAQALGFRRAGTAIVTIERTTR